MKQIIFPGHHRQPCQAFYSVFMDSTSFGYNAHIVVVQTTKGDAKAGTFLSNTDEGRDNILNRIIETELQGIRIDYIKFTVIFDFESSINGTTWPIHINADSYIENGNPHASKSLPPENLKLAALQLFGKAGAREITFSSYDAVGGCTKVYTVFEEGNPLEYDEINRLLNETNYNKGN